MEKKNENKPLKKNKAEKIVEKERCLVPKEAPKPPVIEGSLDLKETLEMLKGFDLLLDCGLAIVKDGKVNWKDAATALKLLKQFEVIKDAAKDVSLIPDELKDLDQNEIVIFARELYPIHKKLKEFILKVKSL